jgi:hypothetical protein
MAGRELIAQPMKGADIMSRALVLATQHIIERDARITNPEWQIAQTEQARFTTGPPRDLAGN